MDRKQELMYYYWFVKSKIEFNNLIEIEFRAFKHAMICGWKLFKAYKFMCIEGDKEITIVAKN